LKLGCFADADSRADEFGRRLPNQRRVRLSKAKPPNGKSETVWSTLLGQGHAFVVGLPADFALTELLKRAKKIQLATAFAHRGGWQYFRQGILDGTASVSLLTGLEFFQTEPALLKEWLDLTLKASSRIEAKLASDDSFFHPKVLIVTSEGNNPDFAIVGSGNLSQGGLHDNTECGMFIENSTFIKQLSSWFEA
jgi:phosphatidylserine/phosphatidylglycerophosphate/cardiolipin synthase-like enzyme